METKKTKLKSGFPKSHKLSKLSHVVTLVSTAVPILIEQKSHSDVNFCGIIVAE